MMEASALLAGLAQHNNGSETIWKNWPRQQYTDGVKYLADNAGARWLVDDIFIHNTHCQSVAREEFQVWKLRVLPGSRGELTCEDGNDKVVFATLIEYTDFPLPEITLWLENGVLMLPSER